MNSDSEIEDIYFKEEIKLGKMYKITASAAKKICGFTTLDRYRPPKINYKNNTIF